MPTTLYTQEEVDKLLEQQKEELNLEHQEMLKKQSNMLVRNWLMDHIPGRSDKEFKELCWNFISDQRKRTLRKEQP